MVGDVLTATYTRMEQQSRRDDEQAEKALQATGIRIVTADANDVAAWRKIIANTNRRLGAEGVFNPRLLDQVTAILQEYRSRKAAAAATGAQAHP